MNHRDAASRIETLLDGKSQDLAFMDALAAGYWKDSKYITFHPNHRSELDALHDSIVQYLDESSKRPHVFEVVAKPGSGKSFLVQELAKSLSVQDLRVVECNMSTVRDVQDLVGALELARNIKAEDGKPLLFLDEVDSDPKAAYPMLLSLLWDGKIQVGAREIVLGRAVVAIAGSKKSFRKWKAKGIGGRGASREGKLPDLKSRVAEQVKIPSINHKNRRADKACLLVARLLARFSGAERIPIHILRFADQVEFEFEGRSLQRFVDWLPGTVPKGGGDLRVDYAELAPSLEMHVPQLLSGGDFEDVKNAWKNPAEGMLKVGEPVDWLAEAADRVGGEAGKLMARLGVAEFRRRIGKGG